MDRKPRQPKMERARQFNLAVPGHAYVFGLLQTGGHLRENTRNRGNVSISLSIRDAAIIHATAGLLPVPSTVTERSRATNFTAGVPYESIELRVYDWGFRLHLKSLGLPPGKKSDIIAPPAGEHSVPDYWRGIIDGDGSLGITGKGLPFVSLVTASEALAEGFKDLVASVADYRPVTQRNKRDGVYNIVVLNENAQRLAALLYYDGCLAIGRKVEAAASVAAWIRPERKAAPGFTPEEDELLRLYPVPEARARGVNRPAASCYARRRILGISARRT